jgi:undecaprenyl-diphosphatase
MATGLNAQIFQWIHPRPYRIGLGNPLFPHGPENSFPSDHAPLMFAAAFYMLMAGRWAACGIPILTVGTLTAWGRVYSCIHFPLDMAGSLVTGQLFGLNNRAVERK